MNSSSNTILITGGGTGIGLALARAFLERSNKVLISGRRESKLIEAKAANPALLFKVCDISNPIDRKALADWAIAEGVNILINDAGMQRQIDLTKGISELEAGDNEIRINFEGTVYLTSLLIPHLVTQKNAAIFNVSSGLGFVPMAIMPIYCATKSAIHTYTVCLRHQLQPTGVKVFEIVPPTVDTELDRGARAKRGQTNRGISATQVAEEVLRGMSEDKLEIAVGMSGNLIAGSRTHFDEIFQRMNGPR